MASSVARMPSGEWRHHYPSRLHVRTHNPLAKVLTTISTSIKPSPVAAAAAAATEPLTPVTAAKRRQSEIIDRWATHQAREIVTTVERQNHEAELSALSTTTQPVSARAASLIRETSPDSSVAAAVPAVGGGGDIPPTVRASSLIQMWRELEAEAGLCPTPRASSTAVPPAAAAEESPGGEEAKAFCKWDNAGAPSSASLSAAESETSERRKVGDIVRMLSRQILSSTTSSGDESDLTAKEITVNAPAAVLLPSPAPLPLPLLLPRPDTGGKALRVRRRREMEDFILKLVEERRREVAALAERRSVSRFPFRGRIQSLIRLRSLRQEVATIKHQQWSQKLEAERFQTRSNNFFLRKRPEEKSHHDINEALNEESLTTMEVQPLDSDVSVFSIPINLSDGRKNHFPESIPTREIQSSPQTFYTPQAFFAPITQYEDLQESRSSDASWDEQSLWGSSVDWQRPSDSRILRTSHGEAEFEGTETFTREQNMETGECGWLSQQSNSCRGWGVIRRSFYNDLLNTNFTENGEIRKLLEMKTVSTSLASEFSTKMNQMIASFLQKQGQQYADVNSGEEHEEQGVWKQNYESSYDQEGSAMLQNQESWQSVSLPLPSPMFQNQENWQNSSFTQSSSLSVQEGEDTYNRKYSVAQIHHEISELRKLVESSLDWQKKLVHSIKQEVFSAFNQLAERGIQFQNFKCMQGRKDTCCICCEAQVDTLLYRCGHMCACYNCAQELQWSRGRCPICRSLIADVIRAYPNS